VEQVVINLVVNARDAMPGGGRIVIGTRDVASGPGRPESLRTGSYVGLVVSDTGHGMDAAVLERAFEPFFTTKAVGEGTGLGLSTVYGIVKQSEGEVFVTSAPGEGATFTLYFPSAPEPASDEPGANTVPTLTPGHETVLLVEDEPMVRDLFRDVLEASGYRVLEAGNGIEALEVASRFEGGIDLLVTDVIMPGMAGGELVRRMAEVRPATKVLYVSGYTDDALVRRGVIDAGVSFLQKPCMPDELSRVVRQILG
jgi:CheY-like chemotaxis protein